MQKLDGKIVYSASDIVNFLECENLTRLDRIHLKTPLQKSEDSEETRLLQDKGYAHENAFEDILQQKHNTVIDISKEADGIRQMEAKTLSAMHSGVEIICQATLINGSMLGHADFLRRVQVPSKLGDYSYEVIDTKLAKAAKAKFLIQLAFYSSLVSNVQGTDPGEMHIIYGDRSEAAFRYSEFKYYFNTVQTRFLDYMNQELPQDICPSPCTHCDLCHWRNLCTEKRVKADHLSQVANITKLQIKKLQDTGITSLEQLGMSAPTCKVPKMHSATFAKLRSQASLQLQARASGQGQIEMLPWFAGKRGFSRLPQPANGDLFFDMEGNPLEDDGLEYLFGIYCQTDDKPEYIAFWAHTRTEERNTFEQFMDLVTSHLANHPGAHIYHYGHYEETALKKLMTLHGTREAEVDNLLRSLTLIDLYKVVREGIRVSEPRYSIKNIENFYLDERSGEVTNAATSIVYYEKWKESGDDNLLKDIEQYNFDDVRSTFQLREWLLGLKPESIPWSDELVTPSRASLENLNPHEMRLLTYREKLLGALPKDPDGTSVDHGLRELTFQLLDFHRRAEKPLWWAMFSRQDMETDELIEDNECLGGLVLDHNHPPYPEKRSTVYTYLFPEQETKLKSGDNAVCIETLATLSGLTVKEGENRVVVKHADRNGMLGETIDIGPGKPITTKKIREAIFRYADSVIGKTGKYRAIRSLLSGEEPRIAGHAAGTPIIDEAEELLPQLINAVEQLQESVLFIQGPPGSGKTYSGSHVIAALIERGYRVGVTSNSHKAINNLLEAVEEVSLQNRLSFRGVKKSTRGKQESEIAGRFIEDVYANDDAMVPSYQLIAGTAWLFSDLGMDQSLDYLFVDEAGQVALANLVAMATSCRNVVLLGDQMQLGQPIQGVHPGCSGDSSLEYLLGDKATIPPGCGVFLKTTWRMHPNVCKFISDAIYDSRLEPEPGNIKQELILGQDAHPMLKNSGIQFCSVEHDGCSQKSEEEAEIVNDLVTSLLMQQYLDKNGDIHRITLENILVVAPYNMQVNLLKKVLPEGARIGTVDKFQGQEAEVVIVSMATSSEEYLPRFVSFLYSKNRLNVALSRARSLAVLVTNPALLSIKCKKPEDMALVNTLCWVMEYPGGLFEL